MIDRPTDRPLDSRNEVGRGSGGSSGINEINGISRTDRNSRRDSAVLSDSLRGCLCDGNCDGSGRDATCRGRRGDGGRGGHCCARGRERDVWCTVAGHVTGHEVVSAAAIGALDQSALLGVEWSFAGG